MSKSGRGIEGKKDDKRTQGSQETKKNTWSKDLKEVLVLKGVMRDKMYVCPSSLPSNKVKRDKFDFTCTPFSSYEKS